MVQYNYYPLSRFRLRCKTSFRDTSLCNHYSRRSVRASHHGLEIAGLELIDVRSPWREKRRVGWLSAADTASFSVCVAASTEAISYCVPASITAAPSQSPSSPPMLSKQLKLKMKSFALVLRCQQSSKLQSIAGC